MEKNVTLSAQSQAALGLQSAAKDLQSAARNLQSAARGIQSAARSTVSAARGLASAARGLASAARGLQPVAAHIALKPLMWLRGYYSDVCEKQLTLKQTLVLVGTQLAFLAAVIPNDAPMVFRMVCGAWAVALALRCKRFLSRD